MNKEEEKLNIAQTVAKGGTINVISSSIAKILGILFYFLILRLLPEQEAGLYFIVFAIFGFAHTITSIGIPVSVNRFIPFYLGRNKDELVRPLIKKMGIYLSIMSILICFFLFVFSQNIADFYGEPALNDFIMLAAITTPFMLFFNFFCGILRGIKRFFSYAAIYLFDHILKFAILTFMIFFVSRTAFNAFLSITISLIISTIIAGIYVMIQYKKFPNKNTIEIEETKGIFSYGIPMYISSLGSYLSGWTDTLTLGFYLTTPIVAAYNSIGLIARNIGPVISLPLSQIMQPMLANLYGKGSDSKEYFEDLARYYGKWALILGLPVLIVFTILSYQLMHIVFPQYESYHWLLWIMGPTFFITLVAAPFRDALWAIGRSDIFMASSLIIVIPNLVLNIILIPIYGVLGAAVASSITYILAQSIFIYYGYKLVNIRVHNKVPIIFIIAGLCAILLFFYAQYIETIWQIPDNLYTGTLFLCTLVIPYLIIYIVLLYFVIGVNEIEKKLFKSLIKKLKG
ncbi:oligosaccharide flippase family protein [Candidatus Micrarchaeota archaeon]|nr:oligosaccharide flippase family protein [Candidatus Micrarchaeota archaeon]